MEFCDILIANADTIFDIEHFLSVKSATFE